jgi:hypothetical protein
MALVGCRVFVAPLDAAESIASAVMDRNAHPIALARVYSHDIVGLQCLLAGLEPFTPSQPLETRYSAFTRSERTLTNVDVALAMWRAFVAGEWRSSDADISNLAEEGTLEGALVFVAPDAFVDALAAVRDESTLADQWARAYREYFDAATSLRELIRAARAAKDTGKRVFLVDIV